MNIRLPLNKEQRSIFGYWLRCPLSISAFDLCNQCRTRKEALANIKEAIKLLLEYLISKTAGQRVEEVNVSI